MRMIPRQLSLALESENFCSYSVDDFVLTGANQALFNMLESWPNWPMPIVILTGAKSSGKTHLAAIWAAQSLALQCDKANLTTAIHAASQGVPILLEDMTAESFDEVGLFHLMNVVYQARLDHPSSSLLMTSQFHFTEWKIKLADLYSRLKTATLLEITPPDDRLLHAVLTKLFADRQLMIDRELIHFIVRRLERSLEKAVEFVQLIDKIALQEKSKLTRRFIFTALAELEQNIDHQGQ